MKHKRPKWCDLAGSTSVVAAGFEYLGDVLASTSDPAVRPETGSTTANGERLLVAMSDSDANTHILGDVLSGPDRAEFRFTGLHPQFLSKVDDLKGLNFYVRFFNHDEALRARGPCCIELWSNTGLYGAGGHKFVPAFARGEPAAQLAKRWIAETREAWRPLFLKIGVNRGPLDEIDRKLV